MLHASVFSLAVVDLSSVFQKERHALLQNGINFAGLKAAPAKYDASPCKEWCGLPEKTTPMKCGIFWFLHVPKTGGTTLMSYFNTHAAEQGWTYADMWNMAPKAGDAATGPIHWATWNKTAEWQKVEAALEEDAPKVLVHTHHNMPGLGNRFFATEVLAPLARKLESKGCELRFGAVLRDAVEHVKSAAFFGAVRDSDDMAKYGPRNTNPMTKYVVYNYQSQWPYAFKSYPSPPGVDDTLYASAQKILSNFSLVGRTEELGEFVRTMNLALGWPEDMVAERENTTPNDHHYKLSRAEVKTLEKLNLVDNKLYKSFCRESTESICESRRAQPPVSAPTLIDGVIDLDLPFRRNDDPNDK